jgi:GNAT superfamily N-acetyltransferase
MMAGMSGGWVLRPFSGVADHGLVEALWLAALEGRWPLLPRANAMVRDGHWARWFRAGNRDILLARDGAGTIAATLLLDRPGADTVFEPILGPAAATISCVGVAPRMEGRGIGTALVTRASEILRNRGAGTWHISWTVRESFYTRAGYPPWRR